MDAATVIGASMGLFGGVGLGFVLGRRFRAGRRRGAFWAASGGSILVGAAVVVLGQMFGTSFIVGAGLGLVTGGLNGLRWGMGRLSDTPRRDRQMPGEQAADEGRPEDHTPHPAT